MKISVIMPVYNARRFLRRSINSVIQQSFQDWELIIIDDGSKDGSEIICKKYVTQNSKISFYKQRHLGQACARNVGLSLAKGEYIAFIDADDYMHPRMLQTLFTDITAYDADLSVVDFTVTGKFDFIPQQGISIYTLSGESKSKEEIVCKDNVYLWNKLYKKELFAKIRFPEKKFYEDTAIMHTVFENAKKTVWNKAKLYYYYQNPKGTIGSISEKKIYDCLWAYEKRLCFYYRQGYMRDLEHSVYMFLYKAYELFESTECLKRTEQIRTKKNIRIKVKYVFEKYNLEKMLPLHGKMRYRVFLHYPQMYKVYGKIKNLILFPFYKKVIFDKSGR